MGISPLYRTQKTPSHFGRTKGAGPGHLQVTLKEAKKPECLFPSSQRGPNEDQRSPLPPPPPPLTLLEVTGRAFLPCLLGTFVQRTLHGQVPRSLVDGQALADSPGERVLKSQPALASLAAPDQVNGLVR